MLPGMISSFFGNISFHVEAWMDGELYMNSIPAFLRFIKKSDKLNFTNTHNTLKLMTFRQINFTIPLALSYYDLPCIFGLVM